MRKYLQHCLNSGHLYCRFMDLGVGKENAIKILRFIERSYLYCLLYRENTEAVTV